jgi:hypothetical protein
MACMWVPTKRVGALLDTLAVDEEIDALPHF